jgi:hypothetical protein
MVEARIFRIFRYTNPSDDILTPSPNPFLDRIDFNLIDQTDSKKTFVENAFVLTCERNKPEGLGINLTAEKPDGVVQPLQVIEEVWTIKGFISNMRGNSDDGNNTFLLLMEKWKNEAQVIKDVWEGGVFGIEDFSNSTNTLLPIGTGSTTVGLIFSNYTPISNYNKNRVDFTLEFRKSRGLDV